MLRHDPRTGQTTLDSEPMSAGAKAWLAKLIVTIRSLDPAGPPKIAVLRALAAFRVSAHVVPGIGWDLVSTYRVGGPRGTPLKLSA